MAYKPVENSRKPHDALFKAHHVVFDSFEPVCKQYLTATKPDRNGTDITVNLVSFITVGSVEQDRQTDRQTFYYRLVQCTSSILHTFIHTVNVNMQINIFTTQSKYIHST